jgi:hypothetical protein
MIKRIEKFACIGSCHPLHAHAKEPLIHSSTIGTTPLLAKLHPVP